MAVVHQHILARTKQVPAMEQIVERLCQAGYDAKQENVCGHATTSLAAEIRYAPNRLPIVVNIMHDLVDDPDEADYEWEREMERLVDDANIRSSIRRIISVSNFDNADAGAVQAVIDFLRAETDGVIIANQ
jgi:hypothetical protein